MYCAAELKWPICPHSIHQDIFHGQPERCALFNSHSRYTKVSNFLVNFIPKIYHNACTQKKSVVIPPSFHSAPFPKSTFNQNIMFIPQLSYVFCRVDVIVNCPFYWLVKIFAWKTSKLHWQLLLVLIQVCFDVVDLTFSMSAAFRTLSHFILITQENN